MKILKLLIFISIWSLLSSCNSEIEIEQYNVSEVTDAGDIKFDGAQENKTSVWLGGEDSRWNNLNNWENGNVPTEESIVQISKDCINCDINLSQLVKVRSLKFDESYNGNLKLKGKNLQIVKELSTSAGTTIHTQCANLTFNSHTPASGNINNIPTTPSVSVMESSTTEGEALRVRFELSEPDCSKDITLNYSINDLQATGADYTAASSGQVTISQGEVEGDILITTNDDSDFELEESLLIEIESIENNEANLDINQALGTIIDNDTAPVLSVIACAPVTEGNDCSLTFQLDKAVSSDVSFGWETVDASATGGNDYISKKVINVIIPAGDLTISQVIKTINDYPVSDTGESFNVQITEAQGASIGGATASITLNEASSNPLALSPSYVEINSKEAWDFSATGGNPPYTYSIQSGVGSIDSNGRYTAPDSTGGAVVIQVQDADTTVVTSNLDVNITYSDLTFCSDSFDFANEGKLFDSGGVGADYSANENCNMWLYSDNGNDLSFNFNSFVMGDGDSLTIRDGDTFNIIAIYDKNNLPPTSLETGADVLRMTFVSDGTTEAAGFDISYSSISPGGSLGLFAVSDPSSWEVGWDQTIYIEGGKGPYSLEVTQGNGTVNLRSGETHIADFRASFTGEEIIIEVTDSDGVKAQLNATVVSTPLNISSLSKTEGGGNETIYVYGEGFQPQMEVFFGAHKCLNMDGQSSSRLRCTIPVGKGTVDVSVASIHPSKSELQIMADAFRYYPGVWTPFTSQPGGSGEDRYGAASVWTGEHFMVWGGSNGSSSYNLGNYNNGYVYHALTDSWSTMSSSGMNGKVSMAYVWTGTEFIIHNGLTNTNLVAHEGKAYNPYTDSWRALATPPVTNFKFGRIGIWTGEEMIVTGGRWSGSSTRDSFAYDPVKDTWRQLDGMVHGRSHHDMIFTGERVISYGGYSGGSRYGDVQIYNFNTDLWTSGDDTYDVAKYGADYSDTGVFLAWTGNRMVIAGGSTSGGDRNGVYNPYLNTWESITQSSSSPYSSGRLVYTGKDIVYHRGTMNMSYDIYADEWSNLQDPVTSNSGYGAFHNNGNSLYQCFGSGKTSDFCENLNIEDLNNPVTNINVDEWDTMSTVSEATGRNGHSLTWSGKYIILFGGEDSTGLKNDGYLYDPFKEEWTLMTTTNAPIARKSHKAIWLGERLLVWGGVDGAGNPLNSGAIYHPEFNTWTTVNTTNAPVARSKFAIAKTNGKVLIWGGLGAGATELSDGAIYDFYTDSWTTVSQTNKPAGGQGVRGVFAGRNTIAVFGGTTNQGAMLDVASNSWSQMSLTNAPNVSRGHSLIFSKNKLVVFGGDNGAGINSDIKIYNPNTDVWVTQAHGLTARKNHTSLMLGNKLFLYGGEDAGGLIGNAQILDLNDFSHEDINSDSVAEGKRVGVWIGHIGEDHYGYRNNHTGDTYGVFMWGGKSSGDDFLTNGVIYKPDSF